MQLLGDLHLVILFNKDSLQVYCYRYVCFYFVQLPIKILNHYIVLALTKVLNKEYVVNHIITLHIFA